MSARPVSKWRVFVENILEDRDFYFFTLSYFALLLGFILTVFLKKEPSNIGFPISVVVTLFIHFCGVYVYFQRHRNTAKQLTSTKPVPVVCVVGKKNYSEAERTFEQAKKAIWQVTRFRDFTAVERFFKISYRRTIVFRSSLPEREPSKWAEVINDTQELVDRFADALSGRKIYHIFIQGPASLAIGLGAVFGWKHPLIAYQWIGEGYKPVLDLRENPRRIKERATELRFINIDPGAFQEISEDTAVVLCLASHDPQGMVERYLRENNLNWKMIVVKSTYGSTLTEDDWVPVIQEINQVFHRICINTEVKRIHLFHSMPVALAFGLGMSLGHFVPVIVYNWKRDEASYYPVLELNKLESWM